MGEKYDFSGWVTRTNIKCSDGRTIRRNAFIDNDGMTVPLVWGHQHGDPFSVLGHMLLENREEGVYGYGKFNTTESGRAAKVLVDNGDVDSLSIYANRLQSNGSDVIHGMIREVSLVLAGANPGAHIDNVLSHGEIVDDEAMISNSENRIYIEHACKDKDENDDEEEVEEDIQEVEEVPVKKKKKAAPKEDPEEPEEEPEDTEEEDPEDKEKAIKHAEEENMAGKTVKDVFDAMTEEQKNVVYALIGQAIEDAKGENKNSEDDEEMKHNLFMDEQEDQEEYLSHDDLVEIFADAKKNGSLKDAFIAHGIENLEVLFPDATSLDKEPQIIDDDMEWVAKVMNGVHHTPFSRIKSLFANLSEPEARAKGYVKGHRKFEEVFSLLKRVTNPTTIYKKQAIDRDDVSDIVDLDVVAFMKREMRIKLEEEIARAVLIGDGRSIASPDKIDEQCIRPIWTDDDLFTIKKAVSVSGDATPAEKAKAFMRQVLRSRKEYKGTGRPTMYTSEDWLSEMLLLEDGMGHRMYKSEEEIATALRVKEIVTVPDFENVSRNADGETRYLIGLMVNLADYNMGADKGGAVSLFDDFDIDYNQYKYLIETRGSGALTKPYSAVAFELSTSAKLLVDPEDPSTVLLGKAVNELQKDIAVNDDYITGVLHFVTDYTGFSGDPAEQSGNYLALKFEATEGATTKIHLLGSTSPEKELDEDMQAIFRITNKNTQKIRVTTTKDDISIVKTYGLRGLVLEAE